MSFDNRVFNINGKELSHLKLALKLAFELESIKATAYGWYFHPEKGLVFTWERGEHDHTHRFPVPLDSEKAAELAWEWIHNSEDAKSMRFDDYDEDADHDGHNEIGWRVFIEEWGMIDDDRYAMCCVRPTYLWYGK